MNTYTYHHLPLKLIRVDDQIKAADGASWLDPVTKVDTHSRAYWTRVWWSTRPTSGTVSPPDLERPNDQKVRVRRPRPNHDVTLAEVAEEFARHGCRTVTESDTRLRVSTRHRSALLVFYYDTGAFNGAYIGSSWVRSIDVVRRYLGVPTHH